MLCQLTLGCGLEWADVTGDLPCVLAPLFARESFAAVKCVSDANYPGWEVTVAFQALVHLSHIPLGAFLHQDIVVENGFDSEVIFLQSLPFPSPILLFVLLH